MPQTGIVRLLTSSKALAVLGAMLGVIVLMILKIDPTQFVDFIKWAIPAYVIGASAEDAAQKLAQRPPPPPSSLTINTVRPPAPGDIVTTETATVPKAPAVPSGWTGP